tara:strand:+ start:219 stop:557 length:339 start_codon:yes stop_codon:yes gene_type:complete
MKLVPKQITLNEKQNLLEIDYGFGEKATLTFEFMRVHSPSAEVRGHGMGHEVLQTGKKNVKITSIESIGNYALKLNFSDGHNTGIYSWDYLRMLVDNKASLWDKYLKKSSVK